MNITIRNAKKEEIPLLEHIHDESFEVNRKYFPNGILPGPPVNETDKYSFVTLFDDETYNLLVIELEEIVGGARLHFINNEECEVDVIFISPKVHGKGIGYNALRKIEDSYPNVKLWRLLTPTHVIKNAVFYINKCGYSIVRVADYDRTTDFGMYVFEKRR